VRVGAAGTAVFAAAFLLSAAAPVRAQTSLPPLPGYLPSYEVTRIARAAGFDPLAPPLREGTNFVMRATDFRGILMRVVVDARTGAIRAVNRIVSDSSPYGDLGMLQPPYGPPPYGAPRFGPLEFDGSEIAPYEDSMPPPQSAPAVHAASHPRAAESPPLPRPRPATLAAHKAWASAKTAPALARPSPAPVIAKKPLPQFPD